MGKFDIIAFSKTKAYKITLFSVLGLGLVLIIIGLVMMMMVTPTTVPNRLSVEMSGLGEIPDGLQGQYQVTLSKDTPIIIYTGTGRTVLESPIIFDLDEDAVNIIEQIEPMRREGDTMIKLKSAAPNHSEGWLTIRCGSYVAKIRITTYLV
jgi:hypothetical protein